MNQINTPSEELTKIVNEPARLQSATHVETVLNNVATEIAEMKKEITHSLLNDLREMKKNLEELLQKVADANTLFLDDVPAYVRASWKCIKKAMQEGEKEGWWKLEIEDDYLKYP